MPAQVGCHPTRRQDGQGQVRSPAATLITDSAQYTVRFVRGLYRARIGFRYTNRSGGTVSEEYCRIPGPPALEKNVGGHWVVAYTPVLLLCQMVPPFRVRSGRTYRGALFLTAAPRGGNTVPMLQVDSIPGTYRLHWALRAGENPSDLEAPMVEAISNTFRLVESVEP